LSGVDLVVPDIGNFADILVVDVLVKKGDAIEVDAPLVTLETDKASMDVPATSAGTVTEVLLKAGDKVSKGTVIARVETNSQAAGAARQTQPPPVLVRGRTQTRNSAPRSMLTNSSERLPNQSCHWLPHKLPRRKVPLQQCRAMRVRPVLVLAAAPCRARQASRTPTAVPLPVLTAVATLFACRSLISGVAIARKSNSTARPRSWCWVRGLADTRLRFAQPISACV